MEETLNALGGILLRGIPTLLLVWLLHFYLKRMFFRPLERILHSRREATEGARKAAEASFARAGQIAAQYEEAIRNARTEIYREQEEMRRRWRQEQAARVQEARRQADEQVREAREQLERDVEAARERLASESDMLANQITEKVLAGRFQ